MKTYDGTDIKFLLEKKGYSLSDVARELGLYPQTVWQIIWGFGKSQRIVSHIERLLGWTPGKLKIARASNHKAA